MAKNDCLKFYGEHLFKAEKEWTKSIRSEKSDIIFPESQKWIKEKTDTKCWDKLTSYIKSIFCHKKANKYKPDGWFKDAEEEMQDIYDKRGEREKVVYDCLLGKTSCCNVQDHKIALEKDVKNNYKLSSRWYVRKSAFSYIFSCCQNVYLCIMMLCSFGVALVNVICGFGVSINLISPLFFLLTVLVPVRYFAHKRNFFSSHIYFPRLLISIITGWVTIYFGTTVFSALDKVTHDPLTIFIAIAGMVVAVGLFMYVEIGRLNPHIERYSRLGRTLYLILISFFYSYTVGSLLAFLKAKELFKTFTLNYESLDNEHYSQIRGFWDTGTRTSDDTVVLFLFTFFAMFIGIFLNLMIQEKRATEPL